MGDWSTLFTDIVGSTEKAVALGDAACRLRTLRRVDRRELPEEEAVRCAHCGSAIWTYGTPSGHTVALDDAPGPYLIIGTKAHRSSGRSGFRAHWEYCRHPALYSSRIEVLERDFLWR